MGLGAMKGRQEDVGIAGRGGDCLLPHQEPWRMLCLFDGVSMAQL